MGGTKKKPVAKQEKTESKTKKGKKGEKTDGGSKAEISVILTDQQAAKVIKGSKVITASELARQTGVKISAANAYLKKSFQEGAIKRVGGHSGHYIYQPSD